MAKNSAVDLKTQPTFRVELLVLDVWLRCGAASEQSFACARQKIDVIGSIHLASDNAVRQSLLSALVEGQEQVAPKEWTEARLMLHIISRMSAHSNHIGHAQGLQ